MHSSSNPFQIFSPLSWMEVRIPGQPSKIGPPEELLIGNPWNPKLPVLVRNLYDCPDLNGVSVRWRHRKQAPFPVSRSRFQQAFLSGQSGASTRILAHSRTGGSFKCVRSQGRGNAGESARRYGADARNRRSAMPGKGCRACPVTTRVRFRRTGPFRGTACAD